MYRRGSLQISPNCPPEKVEDYACDCTDIHPRDERDGYRPLIGGVYLGHSCGSWVIGGIEQIDALIADLEAAKAVLHG